MASSDRPIRCMRLDELSNDTASDPVRCPFALTSSRSVTPLSEAMRSSSPPTTLSVSATRSGAVPQYTASEPVSSYTLR